MTEIELILALRQELNEANYKYYVLSQPTLSDMDFDFKLKELQRLEALHPEMDDPSSPTRRVGCDISQGFQQAYHKYPMLSLANTYNEQEIRDFDARVRSLIPNERVIYDCELKFDGISISLTYEKGVLTRAVTRGDGEKGDDVTNNVRTIKSIPLKLSGNNYPDFFEIRGEVLMPHSSFEKVNKEREANGEAPMANCRNAASGTIKSLDSSVCAKRGLDCFLYFLLMDNLPTNSHFENLNIAKSWGFKILTENNGTIQTDSIDGIIEFIKYWDTERRKLPFDIDGIVIKVDSMSQRNQLGLTSKVPRWAIAYKYKAEQVVTKLERVDFQVSRYGAVTPVANVTPVHLAGTMVKRATLHNDGILTQLDLHYDDYVYIEKSAEIIPKITKVDLSKRSSNAVPVRIPSNCPECGAPLVKSNAIWYCTNSNNCKPQVIGKLIHFTTREAMDIKIGEATITKLYDAGLVRNVSDFYKLTKAQLLTLPKIKDKSAQNLLDSINNSRMVPFDRVLYALSIRNVGSKAAKALVKRYGNINNLINANVNDIANMPDVGNVIAVSLKNYLADLNSDYHSLLNVLNFSSDDLVQQQSSDKLKDKSFVITGTFDTPMRRLELENYVTANGGSVQSSVNSKTDYVIAGSKPGSNKIEKATKLGITIINETEFMNLIA